jgi:hypothetical protein
MRFYQRETAEAGWCCNAAEAAPMPPHAAAADKLARMAKQVRQVSCSQMRQSRSRPHRENLAEISGPAYQLLIILIVASSSVNLSRQAVGRPKAGMSKS